MGPKLQKRFDRNVKNTRIDLDKVIARLERLGKQDLDPAVRSDVDVVTQALLSASIGLDSLEALVSNTVQTVTVQEESEAIIPEDVTVASA